MFVLLDTNVFVRDWRLTGNAFRVFLESLERIGLRWVVPEIVHAEVENKAEERLAAVKEKLELAVKDLQFLPAVKPDALTFDAAAALVEYKDYFRKIAAGAQARMLPHPDVPHAQLALRATKKRRPFKENGSGYRDALIWCSAMELLSANEGDLCFVTQNTKDFGEAGTLHADLADDLAERGIDAGRIQYFNSLDAFNQGVVLPILERVEGLASELQDGSASLDLAEVVRDGLRDALNPRDVAFVALDWAYECGSVRLNRVTAVSDLNVIEVRRLPSGRIFARASASASIELYLSARDEDFEKFQGPRELFAGMEDDAGMVYDVSTDYPVDISVTFSVIANAEVDDAESVTIEEIEGDHGAMSVGA